MIEIRPEGHIDGAYSDITLNIQDIRSKFGYTILCEISFERLNLNKSSLFNKYE